MIVIDDASKKIESNSLYEIKEDTAKDATVAAAAKTIVDRVDKEYGVVFAKSEVTLNGAKAPNGKPRQRGPTTAISSPMQCSGRSCRTRKA